MRAKERYESATIIYGSAPSVLLGALTGCSESTKAPDVSDNIRKSLDQSGFKDVSVSQDRDKGVVTLTGTVATESDKAQARGYREKRKVGAQVVSDQIAVRPPGNESEAKAVDTDLDKAIDKQVDAVLVKNRLKHDISYRTT